MSHRGAFFLLAAATIMVGPTANVLAADLSVTVKNVSNNNGALIGALCDKATFLKHCAIVQSAKATSGPVVLKFHDVAPGRYAFSVYHDENDNKKMDRNIFGIPKEGYGFSRDAKVRTGPPSFDEAAIEVADGANESALSLNY